MRMSHFVELALALWIQGKPVTICLLGKPGIGKTSAARALAAAMTEHARTRNPESPAALCWVQDLTSSAPEDINGLPFRSNGCTHYDPQEWLLDFCRPGAYGVICLDDLTQASSAMQVAARPLCLERRSQRSTISDNVVIIVTGNRREDKSNASTLPAHFRNSVLMLDIDVDVDEWCNWAGAQPDIDPVVTAFLRWKTTHLAQTPAEADAKHGSFATPRTWAMLGRAYKVASDKNALVDVAHGLVGEGVGTEFLAFARLRDSLVDPKEVLRNPKSAVPNPKATLDTPDKMIAMVTSIAEHTIIAMREGGKDGKKEAPTAFLKALAWVTQGGREYVATAMATYTSNGGQVPTLVAAVKANHTNPELAGLMDFLGRTFK